MEESLEVPAERSVKNMCEVRVKIELGDELVLLFELEQDTKLLNLFVHGPC